MIERDLFKSVHYQTQLLESLSWDETQLAALFEYLDEVFSMKKIAKPSKIKSEIKKRFGEQTADCFTNILNEVMFTYNLHVGSNSYEN